MLLQGYHEWGFHELLNKIDGMFAFAIYEKKKRKLFIARDRVGEKPLFYALTNRYFIFSSTLKAVLSTELMNYSISKESLFYLFSLGYVPEDISLMDNIKKVPPASMCELNTRTRDFKINEYWELKENHKNRISLEEAQDYFYNKITSSALERFEYYGPIGLFISGGLDSTILTSIAHKNRTHFLTYSIILEEDDYSEERYSDFVSNYFNTEHNSIKFTPKVFLDNYLNVITFVDEPNSDFAHFGVYLMAREASKATKVVLTGEGADEIFGGYDHYLKSIRHSKKDAMRRWFGTKLKLRRFISNGTTLSNKDIICDTDFIERLVGYKYNHHNLSSNIIREVQKRYFVDPLKYAQYIDLKTWFAGSLLRKTDSMTMAHGIESRLPYTQHDLITAAVNLPSHFKIDKHIHKYILRKSFKDQIPAEILHRQKHGFNIPLYRWFREELKELLLQYTHDMKVDCLDNNLLESFVSDFLNHRYHAKYDYQHSNFLYCIIVFKQWWDDLR